MSLYPEDVELRLTDAQIASLRTREAASETWDLAFRACPLCAVMTTTFTRREGTGKTDVSLDTSPCGQCHEMRARHGELFDYIVFIIRGQRLLHGMIERAEAYRRQL